MNTPANRPIDEFIEDFHLLKPDGLICFTANVLYSTNAKMERFDCEVSIATTIASEPDVIYLLSPKLQAMGIKDKFVIEKEKIEYLKNTCLLIDGKSSGSGYHIGINPLNSDCDEEKMTSAFVEYIKTH